MASPKMNSLALSYFEIIGNTLQGFFGEEPAVQEDILSALQNATWLADDISSEERELLRQISELNPIPMMAALMSIQQP